MTFVFRVGYTVNPPCRTQVAESRESLYYAKAEFLFMRVGHSCRILGMETFRRLIFLHSFVHFNFYCNKLI